VCSRSTLHEQKTTSTICPDGKNSTHRLLLPLTLDEYCNPSLSEVTLSMRNKDQVVARVALKRQEERGRDDTKPTRIEPTSAKKICPKTRLLMVHQCWIYRLNNIHILSFPEVLLKQAEVRNALKSLFHHSSSPHDGSVSSSFDSQSMTSLVPSAFDIQSMTSIARWLYVFVALSESPIGLGKPVLDIFEESISVISNDVDQYFNKKSPRQQEKAAKDEKNFFHDIADVRGELSMMRSVVDQQEQVWAAFRARLLLLIEHLDSELELPYRKAANAKVGSAKSKAETEGKAETEDMPWKLRLYLGIRANANQIIHETTSILQRLKDRIDKVDQDAERVQNLVPQYLELKRSYASIKESHHTAILGAAVFGLSVVTIIFTPLSFAVALLALPDDGVYLNNATDTTYKHTIAKYTGNIEFPLRLFSANINRGC
jgi:hypothetical protein